MAFDDEKSQLEESGDDSWDGREETSLGGVKEEKAGCVSPLAILAVLGMFAVLGAILVPNFIRARSRGQLTACKSNLKNIGTAMEMYSTDWSGKYPDSFDKLTPNYLKTIPECPAAGSVTYVLQTGKGVGYNHGSQGREPFEDYYFIVCEGDNHEAVSLPEGYPQYDGIQGLIER